MWINLPELSQLFQLVCGFMKYSRLPSKYTSWLLYVSLFNRLVVYIHFWSSFLLFFEVICPMVMEFSFLLASNSVYWSIGSHFSTSSFLLIELDSLSLAWHCYSLLLSQPPYLLLAMSKNHLNSCENATAWPAPTIPKDWRSMILSRNTEIQ